MLTVAEVGAALGISVARVRRVFTSPYPLPFALAPAGAKGGGREQLYHISDVLPRLKDAGFTDVKFIKKLFEIEGISHGKSY
jgi:hypothetical protein